MGQDIDPQETAVHRVEVSGQYSAFGALTLFPIAGLNCSLKIRLPMDAFPCMVTAT